MEKPIRKLFPFKSQNHRLSCFKKKIVVGKKYFWPIKSVSGRLFPIDDGTRLSWVVVTKACKLATFYIKFNSYI